MITPPLLLLIWLEGEEFESCTSSAISPVIRPKLLVVVELSLLLATIIAVFPNTSSLPPTLTVNVSQLFTPDVTVPGPVIEVVQSIACAEPAAKAKQAAAVASTSGFCLLAGWPQAGRAENGVGMATPKSGTGGDIVIT
ncbi:hypothetical protein [Vogesella indigofera]|uniref:hypothetical protein n=1 Tax=Vogesella indigofera TaxID=45465 RepID=UPI0035B1C8D6